MLVDRTEFMASLAKVKPALASGGAIPSLNHFWFDESSLMAYDGGFGIKLALETELSCGLPGSALMGLLSTSVLKEAELSADGNAVQVKLGKARSKLVSLESSSIVWPFPTKLPKGAKATTLDSAFIEALRKVLFVKPPSPATRVEHYGVTVERRKSDLVLYSTDTATMASASVEGAGEDASFDLTLLPRDFAEQIVSQSPDGVELYVLEDCIIARADGIEFCSNLMDLEAIDDLHGIIEEQRESHSSFVPLPAGLEGALSRAEILAGREEPSVSLMSLGSTLTVKGSYALGELDEVLDLDGKLPKASIRVTAGLLRRSLPHAEKISVSKDTLFLTGEPGFVYLVASL